MFCVISQYYIKADHTAIPLSNAGCFVEAVERLFMSFFVFGVQYPQKLRVFYSFIEFIMGISSTTVIPSVRDLVRDLNALGH